MNLRFVAISDTHSKHPDIRLPGGDVLVHAGDISSRGTKEEIRQFLKWFDSQPFPFKVFIAGNHDFYLESATQPEIEALIPPGVVYLKDSGVVIGSTRLWGSPYTPVFFNWAFNKKRGASIRQHWDLIPMDTDVLITHGPVYGFLDTLSNDQHAGCQDLLRKVLLTKPRAHVCGHIHESWGTIQRSGIRFVNAAQVNDRYELVHSPIVFDV